MFYKILYDKKSDLSNFKIINCQVWTFIFKKKCLKFDLKFNDCRLLEYAVSMQYILYEMNSDQIIYSCDVIFNESFKAEADYFSSDWIFNFDFFDKLLQSICFYTQQFLFSQIIESFSASHIVDHVEASTAELSVKLLIELSVKSHEK